MTRMYSGRVSLNRQLPAGRVSFGDCTERFAGFVHAILAFDSFGGAVSGGEEPQQVAEVPCNDAPLTLRPEVDNRLVGDRCPGTDQPETCAVASASGSEEPELTHAEVSWRRHWG